MIDMWKANNKYKNTVLCRIIYLLQITRFFVFCNITEVKSTRFFAYCNFLGSKSSGVFKIPIAKNGIHKAFSTKYYFFSALYCDFLAKYYFFSALYCDFSTKYYFFSALYCDFLALYYNFLTQYYVCRQLTREINAIWLSAWWPDNPLPPPAAARLYRVTSQIIIC